MSLRRRDLVVLAGVAWLLPSRARAGAAGDDAGTPLCSDERLQSILGDVARARASVRTLRGTFAQERTIGLLSAKVRSTGRFVLALPDRLRWQLDPPDDAVYWMTPEGLAYRGPAGQGKVPTASARMQQALQDLRIMLGGDPAALRARYTVSGTCGADGSIGVRAVPRSSDASSPFRQLDFALAADLVSPTHATLVEGPRDRTEITFGALRVNAPVDAAEVSPGGG